MGSRPGCGPQAGRSADASPWRAAGSLAEQPRGAPRKAGSISGVRPCGVQPTADFLGTATHLLTSSMPGFRPAFCSAKSTLQSLKGPQLMAIVWRDAPKKGVVARKQCLSGGGLAHSLRAPLPAHRRLSQKRWLDVTGLVSTPARTQLIVAHAQVASPTVCIGEGERRRQKVDAQITKRQVVQQVGAGA